MVAYQIPKLADVGRRNEASGYQIMLEDVCNPFGVLLVGFLAPDCFDVLWMGENDFTGRFKNVVNGNPVLSGRFHADITAVVLGKPNCTTAQISCESGEPLAFVRCHTLLACRGDTGNQE